jgi:hypothetical protein
MVRFQQHLFLAAGLTALCLPFLAAQPARADGLFSRVETVHVAVPMVENQAQLADRLRAQGYTQVVLSSVPASPAIPHPEANPTLTSSPEQTPVHDGWNGIAVKDGMTVQVYADLSDPSFQAAK